MISQIVQKEMKEKRYLLILGALLCIVPPVLMGLLRLIGLVSGKYAEALSSGLSWSFYTIFWLVFSILIAAPAFSPEMEKGTLDFLLSAPYPRNRVWKTKFFTVYLVQFAFLALFLLCNFTLIRQINGIIDRNGIAFFWLHGMLIALPFAVSAIALYFSTIVKKQLLASFASIFTVLAGIIASLWVFRKMEWDVFPFELMAFCILIACGFLFASYRTFAMCGADAGKKRAFVSLKNLGYGAVAVIAVMAGLYLHSVYSVDIDGLWLVKNGVVDDGRIIAARSVSKRRRDKFDAGDLIRNRIDNRLVLLFPKSGKTRILPVKKVHAAMVSPDRKRILLLQTIVFEGVMRFAMGRTQLWMLNVETGRLVKLDTPSARIYNVKWLDGSHYLVGDTIYDIGGNSVRDSILNAKSKNFSPRFQVIDGVLYHLQGINHEKNRRIYNAYYYRHYFDEIEISRYDFKSGQFRLLAREKCGKTERIRLPTDSVSPDGRSFYYKVVVPEKSEKVIVKRFDDDATLTLQPGQFIRRGEKADVMYYPKWFSGGRLIIPAKYGKKVTAFVVKIPGGDIRELFDRFVFSDAWNAEINVIACVCNVNEKAQIALINVETGEKKFIPIPGAVKKQPGNMGPQLMWMDNNRLLLVIKNRFYTVGRDGRIEKLMSVDVLDSGLGH